MENTPEAIVASSPLVSGNSAPPLAAVSPDQALLLFQQDPIGFVREIVDQAAQTHLADLKEEAELRAALSTFRKSHPEFTRFEPFIMQELVDLLRNDADGGNDPWDKLLEKATDSFKQKMEATVQAQLKPQLDAARTPEAQPALPFMEGAGNRALPEMPPSFTREQIARMSLDEFLKNEAAINEAMKNSRIR